MIMPNVWTHVAVSYDGTEVLVYINGAVTGSFNAGDLSSGVGSGEHKRAEYGNKK